uniref:Ribosome biogenesis regulatory protein n=1 Tax=Albugo laibachii Nc14 TaxID=890382 RepID=F0WAR7_9STRA|nr:ribosome biogenesis regulatory protein putative [Albugo laibachii Nc14]|eukprot:CCA18239.1 ribosome biogenesis regulatory protein putative [Albugo laibachii Nc14]
MALKAAEVAPAAYANKKNSDVKKEDDLEYDLGNLAAFDTHPYKYTNEKDLALFTRENVQLLVNRLFTLPRTITDAGPLAKLPPPTTIIPREKPLPKPNAETKWEKFAKEKGIQKRKKSRMVFDEAAQDWKPNWGYKRANDNLQDWAVEAKTGENALADPWAKRKQAKKARVEKNIKQQAANVGRGGVDKIPSGIAVELAGTSDVKAKQRGKEGTMKTLQKAQFSTASMGKFDSMRYGETERKQKGKRNRFLPSTGAEGVEKERALKAIHHVLSKDGKSNKEKDANSHGEEESRKKKKRGNKAQNSLRKRSKTRR